MPLINIELKFDEQNNYDGYNIVDLPSLKDSTLIKSLTEFYNVYFPETPHRLAYKQKKYGEDSTVVIFATHSGKLVGLLEAWKPLNKPDPATITLGTLVLDKDYRGKGISKSLVEQFELKLPDTIKNIVVHFWDPDKAQLTRQYEKLGFVGLKHVGTYSGGEAKWEMTKSLEPKLQSSSDYTPS